MDAVQCRNARGGRMRFDASGIGSTTPLGTARTDGSEPTAGHSRLTQRTAREQRSVVGRRASWPAPIASHGAAS